MVILGFAGFGWVLGGFGGWDLGRLVWWDWGVVVWLVICGVDCVHTGQKGGFMWVFGREKRAGWGLVGKFTRELSNL